MRRTAVIGQKNRIQGKALLEKQETTREETEDE